MAAMSNTQRAVADVRLRPAGDTDEAFLFALYASTRRDEMAAWGWGAAAGRREGIIMKMTEDLTREALLEQLNSKFLMRLSDAEPLELELASVSDLPSAPGQEQFSVIFRAPLNAPLAQGVYQLEHPQ